jgi:exonuclease V gamma subunit
MELPPVDGAAELLEAVLELYELGRTSAVPFFPRSAWAAAKAGRGDPVAAVERKLLPQELVLIGGYRPEGELERAEYGLVFRDQEVSVDDLVALGRRIFGPMAACLPRQWLP